MFVVFVYFCVANLFFVYYHPTLCSMPSLLFADQQQHPVQGEHDRRACRLQVCRLSISYALSVLLTFTHRSRMCTYKNILRILHGGTFCIFGLCGPFNLQRGITVVNIAMRCCSPPRIIHCAVAMALTCFLILILCLLACAFYLTILIVIAISSKTATPLTISSLLPGSVSQVVSSTLQLEMVLDLRLLLSLAEHIICYATPRLLITPFIGFYMTRVCEPQKHSSLECIALSSKPSRMIFHMSIPMSVHSTISVLLLANNNMWSN